MDDNETWRPVTEPGYEELYEVSSLGQVRSLPRQTSKGVLGGRVLRQHPNGSGHLCVSLSKDGKCIKRDVHKLVAGAFLGPCPPGMEVRHGERGRQCNWVTNLRYGTHAENMQDRLRDGNYANAAKEVCPRHETPYKIRNDGKGRYCVKCETEGMARRRAAKKAERPSDMAGGALTT